MQFFHDPSRVRPQLVDQHVRGPRPRQQQNIHPGQPLRVNAFPLLADAYDELQIQTHGQYEPPIAYYNIYFTVVTIIVVLST